MRPREEPCEPSTRKRVSLGNYNDENHKIPKLDDENSINRVDHQSTISEYISVNVLPKKPPYHSCGNAPNWLADPPLYFSI